MSGNTSAVLSPPVSLGADFKRLEADRVEPRRFQALNETARGLFGFEAQQKFFERSARAFGFDEDALRRIVDPAGQAEVRWRAGRQRDGSRRPAPRRERRVFRRVFPAAAVVRDVFIRLFNTTPNSAQPLTRVANLCTGIVKRRCVPCRIKMEYVWWSPMHEVSIMAEAVRMAVERRKVGGRQPRAGLAPARGDFERRGAGGAAVCV